MAEAVDFQAEASVAAEAEAGKVKKRDRNAAKACGVPFCCEIER